MNYTYKITLFLAVMICLTACKKFLDVKPDKKQVIPASLEDCRALLNSDILGKGYPVSSEISSDDYYLTSANWNALTPQNREPYLWESNANISLFEWSAPYERILVANQVLETLSGITPLAQEQKEWNRLKGTALLLRSVFYFSLAQVFAKPYDPGTAGQDLGIPLRLGTSIDEKIERGNLQQTYHQIVQDLTESVSLLPAEQPDTRVKKTVIMPVKAAALAALARVNLSMGDYSNAFNNADASLKQYGILTNYNTLDTSQYYPIPRFSPEVLLELEGSGLVPVFFGLVNKDLRELYPEGDLRRNLYFRNNGNQTYSFRGTYVPGSIFGGLATDEMYLVRAECSARSGNINATLADLNTLRQARWDKRFNFVRLTADNAEDALKLVILERRRELPFRTLRWTDLRRLNKDNGFTVTLKRTLNGQDYFLPPNDPRYTLLIPREVLQRVNLPQNPR